MNKTLLKEIDDRATEALLVAQKGTLVPRIGRPPIYNADVHPEELITLMEQGYLDVQVYAKWGITKVTFYEWKRSHPEFAEAHDIGMPKCEAVYIRKAQERLEAGDDSGFKYFKSLVDNKFGWNKEEGSRGNTINITNMQVINTKEDFIQLQESVHEKMLELNLLEAVNVRNPEDR